MKIAFASCRSFTVFAQQPVWDQIAARQPDRLLLLGDSVYIDGPPFPNNEHPKKALPIDFLQHVLGRWRVQLELSREMEPAAAIAMLDNNLGEAGEQRVASALSPTRLMLLHAHQRAGNVAAAHQQALLLEASLAYSTAMTVYAGEYFLLMTQACEAAGDTASARRLLQRGLVWVERVRRDHVPSAFQDSFVQRNPINRQLRALAQRLPA